MKALRVVPLAAALALAATPSAAANGRLVEEVAKGLDSPRHLEFGDRGDLFVAEAGEGGQAEPCFDSPEGFACVGATGAVTKVDRWGRQTRVASKLASYANKATGGGGIGPHGIAVVGNDTVIVTNGGPTAPTEPNTTPPDIVTREEMAKENPIANLFGRILLLGPKGLPIPLADTYAFERDVNPDKVVGNPLVDTNPVDVEVDGLSLVFADAGGNALNRVNLLGRISNIALFPNRPLTQPFPIDMQAVPTAVEVGPDGHYYVGQLTGFPFPVGGANVYRVDRRSGAVSVVKGGFTNIMDLAFGKDGTLYVLEIDHNGLFPPDNGDEGAIFAISRRGDVRQISLPAGTLPMPGGITVGNDGLYVTINSAAKDAGKVLRIKAR
jgi:hypothetical protein